MSDQLVRMTKNGEKLGVNPTAVEAHKQVGWAVVGGAAAAFDFKGVPPTDPDGFPEKQARAAQKALARSMVAAKNSEGEQANAFLELGVELFEANGKLRAVDIVSGETILALKKFDAPRRTELTVILFGDSEPFVSLSFGEKVE